MDVAPVRVVVVEDHPVFRVGLRHVLRTGRIDVVAWASDGQEGLDLLREHVPQVALLDIGLPGVDGLGVLQELVEDGPSETRALVLSGRTDGATVHAALAAGAAGYLTKAAAGPEIVQAVLAVARGKAVIAPEVQQVLAGYIREPVAAAPPLTDREREVLALVAAGCSNGEIARRLFVTVATVKTHLAHTYDKLEVTDRTAAAVRALKLGLVDAP